MSIAQHTVRGFVLLAAALLGAGANAAAENECGANGESIIRQAYPAAEKTGDREFRIDGTTITLAEGSYVGSDPHAVVCRIWPAFPNRMLVTVPLISTQMEGGNEGDMDLLVLDKDTLQPMQRLRLKDAMADDAVRIISVTFDTARYRLAPDKMAFGVRISTEGSSRANPFGDTTLRLYAINGEKLVPVLDNIVVSEGGGEWDTNCAGAFDNIERALSMDARSHKGVADILVTETAKSSVAKVTEKGECESINDQPVTRKIRLTYDGNAYVIPPDLRRSGELTVLR
ncbi:hypothetical protein [Agrobacterium sp. NPDC089420]|uniref:hypothetical protein n=1 Tax=Agrobacterium sp. NPDC089420 TaxID=3363918 RepID=UPI00384DDD4D